MQKIHNTCSHLNAVPNDPLSEVRVAAGIPSRDSSHMPIGSALTERQLAALVAIENHFTAHGCAPSQAELGAATDTASKDGVRKHLLALERKGYVRLYPGEHRGICVLLPSSGARLAEPRPIRKTTATLCTRCRRDVG